MTLLLSLNIISGLPPPLKLIVGVLLPDPLSMLTMDKVPLKTPDTGAGIVADAP